MDGDEVRWVAKQFIRIRCEHRHGRMTKPWKIASYSKLSGQWSEINHASKARRLEQKKRRAEIDKMPPAREKDVGDWIARMVPAGDRPGHSTRLTDGRPVEGGRIVEGLREQEEWLARRDAMWRGVAGPFEQPAVPQKWTTHDLTCPRCRQIGRRPATYSRHEEDLFVIFDELVERGVYTVTPEFLARYENERRKRGGVS